MTYYNPSEDKKPLTVREAAAECGRDTETVRRWIWSGKLPAEKIGNQLFIKQNDLYSCREKVKKINKISMNEFIKRAAVLREQIKARTGENFDAAEMIRESREEHWSG